MTKNLPLLSIVIANYNYGRFLEGAIKSVLSQGVGDQVELIICDGGSSDNSVEIIKKYAHGLPPNTPRAEWHPTPQQLLTDDSCEAPSNQKLTTNDSKLETLNTGQPTSDQRPTTNDYNLITWWCSEKDKGQSDAFNKGFEHAKGKFGCWLNADDILMPNAIKVVVEYLERHPKCEWLGGSTVFGDAELKVWKCSRCVNVWPFLGRFAPAAPVNGPSSFFLLDNLRRAGGFDINAHYVMDVDLWRRFWKMGIRLHFVKNYLWCFRLHEESKTASTITEHRVKNRTTDEADRVNRRYGATPIIRKMSENINRFQRFFSGAYFQSYRDTRQYKGLSYIEVVKE